MNINSGHIFLTLKTLGIIYILYLDYNKTINLPMLAVLILLVGTVGMGYIGSSLKEDAIFNYDYQNYITGLACVIILIKKYLS